MGQTITTNSAARHEYFVLETFEAGIELYGTEIKSIRNGSVNLKESWADIQNGEVFERAEDVVWECANCGHLHYGPKAPGGCPVCAHPQSYFKLRATNY